MALSKFPVFFLAANSADGFVNNFNDCYLKKDGWNAYLIKGGPGTGKSTFMKKIAVLAAADKVDIELISCSSDPDSLDGIILKDKKVVVLDATAPHVIEPAYAGVHEHILNFGSFWDSSKLKENCQKIIELTDKNKELHKRASGFISAIGQVMRNNMKISLLATNLDKTFKFSEKLAKRYLKKQNKKGSETVKYLSGITPDGQVFYGDTIDKLCLKKVIINDNYGSVSAIILSAVRDIAVKFGYEIITVKNNILPGEKTDHIIIPEISLAFCTKNSFNNICSENIRLIHAERFMDRDIIKANRNKTMFYSRLINELTLSAVTALREAKAVHDILESYYISAMDFDSLKKFTDEFAAEILR